MASSTTLRVLENGALNAAIPRSAAAPRSIWFVPMQNAPIASRSTPASMARAVTWVFERRPSRCTPGSRAISSSSSSARSTVSTSIPAAVSTASASGWICSTNKARNEFWGTSKFYRS